MAHKTFSRLLAVALSFLCGSLFVATGCADSTADGCSKDTDCKENRICSAGQCVTDPASPGGGGSAGKGGASGGGQAGADASAGGGKCTVEDDCGPWASCTAGTCQPLEDYSPGLSEADLGELGEEPFEGGAGGDVVVGDPIDELCGEPVYYNGPNYLQCLGGACKMGTFGYVAQCTEFAARFACKTFLGCDKRSNPYGHAKSWFTNKTSNILSMIPDERRHASGATKEYPRPGDIITYSSPAATGHVEIVARVDVGAGIVETIGQNTGLTSRHFRQMSVDKNGTVTVKGAIGWMRPSAGPLPACLQGKPPAALPTLIAPTPQAFAGPLSLLFSWDKATGVAAPHWLRVRNLTLDKVIYEKPADSSALVTLDEPGDYRWTVYYQDASCPDGRCAAPARLFSTTIAGASGPCQWKPDGEACPGPGVCVGEQCLTGTGEATLARVIQAAGDKQGVPWCLLTAVVQVESGWNQGASSADGGKGMFQLTGQGKIDSLASRLGVSGSLLVENSARGAYWNARAAALLLSDFASKPLVLANEPRDVVETWFFPIVQFNGGGHDGLLTSSNYPFRVYNQFLSPKKNSIPKLSLDLSLFPPGQGSRDATGAELAIGECNSNDAALVPATKASPCQIRTFGTFDTSTFRPLHRCDGTVIETDKLCSPGSWRCSGSIREQCNVAGKAWQTVEACPDGCEVVGGVASCKAPPVTCPDGVCNDSETCSSCPQDCGACTQPCGNGACDSGETCSSCPQDCGACPSCGDTKCNNGETCASCPQDCGACTQPCGNGSCDGSETCSSCPQDCGACPNPCGNGACDSGETCSSCPQDCGSCCNSSSEWSPTQMSTQATSGSPATTLTVELRDKAGSSAGIEIRVCKDSGTFVNDVHLTFEEWVKYTGATLFEASLSTSGNPCSPWMVVAGTDSWQEGEGLGGEVRVVSPASCASQWDPFCQSAPSPGCGTCWFFSTSTMTRTCL